MAIRTLSAQGNQKEALSEIMDKMIEDLTVSWTKVTTAAGITNTSRNVGQAISSALTDIVIQSLSLASPFIIRV